MFHRKKIKYKFLRKYFLLILAGILLLGVVVLWYNVFLNVPGNSERIILQKSLQEKVLSPDFDAEFGRVMDKFSCEASNEKLIKGVIRQISRNYIIINDQGREYRVLLKPETIFLRIYVDEEQEDVFEINLESLSSGQNVVASVFEDPQGNNFSLLVKQIIYNQDEIRN